MATKLNISILITRKHWETKNNIFENYLKTILFLPHNIFFNLTGIELRFIPTWLFSVNLHITPDHVMWGNLTKA